MTAVGGSAAGYGLAPAEASDLQWREMLAGTLSLGAPASELSDDKVSNVSDPKPAVVFPLKTVAGKRYLEDAAGKPFLIQGDAAWSLIASLKREDAVRYLDDRQKRGFNTVLVELIEHRFASNAPANAYGQQPFYGQPFETLARLTSLLPVERLVRYGTSLATRFVDFTKPNEAYFAHVDWVLREAEKRGFLVLLAPCYAGYEGGTQGWYGAMLANGVDRLRQYGEYLGRRYRSFDNIMWVHAGDYDPPRKDLVRAVAEGIAKFDPGALQTAHNSGGTELLDYWRGESWLQVNNVYTYRPIYRAARMRYMRPERMPFFLIESTYENEHDSTEQQLRMQAYQAILSGAAGQVFGNNPIWHFDGPGLYATSVTWQDSLASRGAQSMTHVGELFGVVPWWRLRPDFENTLLTSGLGPHEEKAVAALSVDRSFAIIYLPSARAVDVDLTQLASPEVEARWYDPANGEFHAVSGSPFPTKGPLQFEPQPAINSSGFDDWVLIIGSP